MFTGIITHQGALVELFKTSDFISMALKCPTAFVKSLVIGASVAVDGVCLTVTRIEHQNLLWFDVIAETLQCTTLSLAFKGRLFHVESSLRIGDSVDGHFLTGHISGRAIIVRTLDCTTHRVIDLECPTTLCDYIIEKGSVALDGVSLTVMQAPKTASFLSVHLIPETQRRTLLGLKPVGDAVNLEVDAQTRTLVTTVQSILGKQSLGILSKTT